jgi:hypothetical protein
MVDLNQRSQQGFAMDHEYFKAILSTFKYSKVYIVAQTNMYQHQTVRELQNQVKAQLYNGGSPMDDWSLATMAPILIGSFGTFTWMAAYLSEGDKIHLPYLSNHESGSHWHPAHNLFIEDDPRIVYHDVSSPQKITHETAREVLARDTIFARAVKSRKNTCDML